ncbi:histidine kinase [Bacillus sp. FJAT-50079]|uniref:sensor histidine kinase n=1 Tax=Bacillus sp. FJAT-50079 TaxID=2833577 RepID=UPI001BC9FF7C|nr:histidine kinase [Bacillus sp. FJAT-50079]MBS4207995.1 histidine kinase [Bacillus sp. FJAT-50079]
MRRISPFWNSLVFKLFLSICFIIGPLIAVLIVNNHYAVDVVRNQVSQSNKNMLNIYMRQIDHDLDGVGEYVFQVSQEGDLYYLQANRATDYNDYVEAKLRLYQSISPQSNFYTTIDSVFIYSRLYKDLIYTQNFGESFIERQATSEEIANLLGGNPDKFLNGQWQMWEGKDRDYLLYLIKNDDVYVGAWVDLETLIFPFEHIDFGESGRALLATSDFKPITQKKFVLDEGINLRSDTNTYEISGDNDRFLVMSEQSRKADFQLVALIPEHTILEKLPFIQRISTFISIGAVLFLLLFIFIMRKVFILPIHRLVRAMKKLRKGDFDIRLPDAKSSSEFELMNESFNEMSSRIRNLKINVYEEKLNHQKAELHHLQLQINPHFFLNSLNIIYNLATVKDFRLIQEMSRSLANYFRFMFKSNSYFVTVEDEIKHTDNYLNIQELRFPNSFSYELFVQEELKKCNIPPLMIQTLVENSIKHAFNMDDPINITVDVWQEIEEPDIIHIQIQDTGEGFPQEVLAKLKCNRPLVSEEGERIGIWNVKRRLKLLYGGAATIRFSNEQGKGATIRIEIPVKEQY